MKKLLNIRLTLIAILVFGSISACLAEKKDKNLQKECKKMSKQLKAEGWTVHGKAISIEEAMLQYYKELENADADAQTLISRAEAKNINQAMTKAQHHLKAQYASMLESKVSGEANIQVKNEASDSVVKSDVTFDSTYESSVNKKINAIKPNLILTRKKDNGNVEIQMYMIVK